MALESRKKHMMTLALELSTDCGSLAVIDEDRILVERAWAEDRLHRQQVFVEIAQCVTAGLITWNLIELLSVGTGPGAFSGLRMAVSALRAAAMPEARPVFAVASAEALAWEIMEETGRNRVHVFGDARCGEIWRGCYRRGQAWPEREGEWLNAADGTPSDAVWVTADWERIGPQLQRMRPSGAVLIEEKRVPRARMVGRLALARCRVGAHPEPPLPIYVHPPVTASGRG